MTDTFKERASSQWLCQNCGKPVSQLGIAYLQQWVHNHSSSARCDAPSVAVPIRALPVDQEGR